MSWALSERQCQFTYLCFDRVICTVQPEMRTRAERAEAKRLLGHVHQQMKIKKTVCAEVNTDWVATERT